MSISASQGGHNQFKSHSKICKYAVFRGYVYAASGIATQQTQLNHTYGHYTGQTMLAGTPR